MAIVENPAGIRGYYDGGKKGLGETPVFITEVLGSGPLT